MAGTPQSDISAGKDDHRVSSLSIFHCSSGFDLRKIAGRLSRCLPIVSFHKDSETQHRASEGNGASPLLVDDTASGNCVCRNRTSYRNLDHSRTSQSTDPALLLNQDSVSSLYSSSRLLACNKVLTV